MHDPADERGGDQLRITGQLKGIQPGDQLGEEAGDLHAGQRRGHAEVHPVAERQVPVGVAADVEAERVGEDLLVGAPRSFGYQLDGPATHRDAPLRHALARLLHWAQDNAIKAIAVEDLDFTDSTTREKHGRRRRFRHLIAGMPTAKPRARLLAMTADTGIAVIAVDPAYTSKWGTQHWQKPLTGHHPQTTRHHAAAVAIGRRALGHPIRRRTAPPRPHQSDVAGHRTAQARPGTRKREETRHPDTETRTRSAPPAGQTNAGNQATQHRTGPPTKQNSDWLSA